jgi:aminoglycoside 3-N-acetyltransferase
VGGQILMLGCGLRPNTSMHAIEELVTPPYLFGHEKTYVLIYPDGHQEERVYMAHGFRHWSQRYDRVAQVLAYPALREAQVLAANVHLIDVPALWQAALAVLAEDELFFVDRDRSGAV